MIRFKSKKEVNYGKPGSSRVYSGLVKLTIQKVIPPLTGSGKVEIYGDWTPLEDNGNVLINLKDKNYTVAQIESIEQNLPAITDTQYLFRNFEPRVIQFVKALLDHEHSVDSEANFGLSGNDIELIQ